jgi:hypothetical protein
MFKSSASKSPLSLVDASNLALDGVSEEVYWNSCCGVSGDSWIGKDGIGG